MRRADAVAHGPGKMGQAVPGWPRVSAPCWFCLALDDVAFATTLDACCAGGGAGMRYRQRATPYGASSAGRGTVPLKVTAGVVERQEALHVAPWRVSAALCGLPGSDLLHQVRQYSRRPEWRRRKSILRHCPLSTQPSLLRADRLCVEFSEAAHGDFVRYF